MHIVLYGTLVYKLDGLLRSLLDIDATISAFDESVDDATLAKAFKDADVIIALDYDKTLPPAPRVKLLQLPGAGTDGIDFDAVPKQAVVCNAFGHDVAIGEYVLGAMLAWRHNLLEADRSMRQGSWHLSGRANAPLNIELCGQTIGIIGLGRIGRAVARMSQPFATRVIACTRTPREHETVQQVHSVDRIMEFATECDFVVVCCALTPETKNIVDASVLRAMKPTAVLINVARGECVNEQALYDALASNRIGGAIIDAWYKYPHADDPHPSPSRFPFAELKNLIMTPHSSGWTTGMLERRWHEMAKNISRLEHTDPLENVVRPAKA